MREIVLVVLEGSGDVPMVFMGAGWGNGGGVRMVEGFGENVSGELTFWINRLIIFKNVGRGNVPPAPFVLNFVLYHSM